MILEFESQLTLPDVHEKVEKIKNKYLSEKCEDAVRWLFQRTCLYFSRKRHRGVDCGGGDYSNSQPTKWLHQNLYRLAIRAGPTSKFDLPIQVMHQMFVWWGVADH